MKQFEGIIGHDNIKRYFSKAIAKNKISHSYLFEGPYGVGKKTFAKAVAKLLLCTDLHEGAPCNECDNCHKIEKEIHPDVITLQKDTKVIKIDNIRKNLVEQMSIKPYQGKYKIVIIPEAEALTTEGQNAMLKVIEEPPAYGIIILITENRDALLPTIQSRCIHMGFSPLSNEEMTEKIKAENIDKSRQQVYTMFAQGSIGMLQKMIQDETFWENRKQSIDYLTRLEKANLIDMYALVEDLTEKKDLLQEILKFWLLWYRDVAVLKAAGSGPIYNVDYKKLLLDTADKLTYNKISQNIEMIKQALLDINQNINVTFIMENLLLKMKERKR